MSQNYIACRLEENFKEPLKFIPERWLKSSESENIPKHLVIPFGSGLRSCMGRRLSQQIIYVLLTRVNYIYFLPFFNNYFTNLTSF